MARLFYSAEKARRSELARMRQELQQLSWQNPEAIAQTLARRCPYCGGLLVPRVEEFEVLGQRRPTVIYPDRHGCAEEETALAREAGRAAAKAQTEQALARRRRLQQTGLAGCLAGATFDSFSARANWPGAEACKARVLHYVQTLVEGPEAAGRPNWLILHGHYGTGKSHLAAAAIHYCLERGQTRCYFRVWTDYLLRLQASWQPPPDDQEPAETEAAIIAELQSGDLVVIDDLDKRRPTAWTRSILFSVLNHRYNARLPTILTFNHRPAAVDPAAPDRLVLEDYLGGAVLDRLIAAAFDLVEFDGPSFRSGLDWGNVS